MDVQFQEEQDLPIWCCISTLQCFCGFIFIYFLYFCALLYFYYFFFIFFVGAVKIISVIFFSNFFSNLLPTSFQLPPQTLPMLLPLQGEKPPLSPVVFHLAKLYDYAVVSVSDTPLGATTTAPRQNPTVCCLSGMWMPIFSLLLKFPETWLAWQIYGRAAQIFRKHQSIRIISQNISWNWHGGMWSQRGGRVWWFSINWWWICGGSVWKNYVWANKTYWKFCFFFFIRDKSRTEFIDFLKILNFNYNSSFL